MTIDPICTGTARRVQIGRSSLRPYILRALIIAGMLAILAAGCQKNIATYYPEWEKSRWERLDLFRNIESLAIAPIEISERIDKDKLRYADLIETAVFDQVMRRQRFRLVAPEQFRKVLSEVKGDVMPEKSAVNTGIPNKEPTKRTKEEEKDLIAAAAKAGADAVLYVRIEDVDPYFPPRVVMRARLYISRQVSLPEQTIINMTDDGVPVEVPRSLRERFVWQRDLVLDAHEDQTMAMVKAFAQKHEVQYHGFGPQIFVRSMARYADFTAAVLAGQLFRDAQFYRTIDRYNLGLRARGLRKIEDNEEEPPHTFPPLPR